MAAEASPLVPIITKEEPPIGLYEDSYPPYEETLHDTPA